MNQANHSWHWYVYIIECLDGLYYTGMTWNLDERVAQHASGKGSAFTARHGFKAIRYFEEYHDIHDARYREKQLKDYSRKKKEALFSSSRITSNNNAGKGDSSDIVESPS